MGSITCIILTKNEEKNLPSALQNAASWADEILVVDSGSDDGTVEIAKKSGASVIYRAWDGDFAAQRNFALTGAMVTGYFILMPTNGLQQGPSKRSLPSKRERPTTITPSAGKILPSVIISIMGRSDRIGSCAFSQKRRSTGRERSTNTPFAPCLLRPFQKGWTIIPMRPLPIGGAKPASTRPFGPMMPTPEEKGQAMEKQPAMPFWACLRSIFSKEDFLKEVWASLPHSSTVSIRP